MLCITFPLLDLLISFKTSSTLTVEKPKACGLNKFLIANTLRGLHNFFIAFKEGLETNSDVKSKSLNPGTSKCFITLEKTNLTTWHFYHHDLSFYPHVIT